MHDTVCSLRRWSQPAQVIAANIPLHLEIVCFKGRLTSVRYIPSTNWHCTGMLERAATCRERGSFRRLFPVPQKALSNRRALHAGFWYNSALDLELSPLYSTFLQNDASLSTQQHNTTAVMQSGFHLDFLYPSAPLNFFRQYMGWRREKQVGQRKEFQSGERYRRLYTDAAECTIPRNLFAQDTAVQGGSDSSRAAGITLQEPSATDSHNNIKVRSPIDNYERAWRKYLRLGELEKSKAGQQILQQLSPSDRTVDAERKIEIFEQLDLASKTTDVYVTAVSAKLRLQDLSGAMKIYQEALRNSDYPAGASEIMAYMVTNDMYDSAADFLIESKAPAKRPQCLSYDIFSALENHSEVISSATKLAKYLNSTPKTSSALTGLFVLASEVVIRALLRSALSGDKKNFEVLLDIFHNWDTSLKRRYNSLLRKLLEAKSAPFAAICYRKARKTRRIKFEIETLHDMLVSFCRDHSARGIHDILGDFSHFYDHPSNFAYRRSMAEFASQGDVDTVHTLFANYLTQCKLKHQGIPRPSDMAPILHVHAKRGELDLVIKYFNEIETTHGIKPDLLCWNILLDAYGKAQNPDGAFEAFENLIELGDPVVDEYTFGTVMGICAARGDFDRVIELYQLSLSMSIETSASMVDCIVLVHIQNDRLQEAEKICESALGMPLNGSKTRMWNRLLVAYAMRRDLAKVNALLERMSEAQVKYDENTYAALMQALAMVGQSQRAHTILSHVMPRAGFKPNQLHYATLMGSYLATGNFRRIHQLREKMAKFNLYPTASTNLMSLRAEDRELFQSGTDAARAERALQIFQEVSSSLDPPDVSEKHQKGLYRIPRHIAYPTMMYSYVISVLSETKHFESANEVFEAFIKILPEKERALPPLEAISAIMMTKFETGDFEMVQKLWDIAVSKAKIQGAPLRPLNLSSKPATAHLARLDLSGTKNNPSTIVPTRRLDLARCLTSYMRSLAAVGKSSAISGVIEGLYKDGFLLDNKNWNEFIQILARHDHFKLAFTHCEQNLMDNWLGWSSIRRHQPVRNRLSVEERNKKKNAMHLYPNFHTFLYLARAFLDLQDAAEESAIAQQILSEIIESCPRAVHAVRTMQTTDGELERQILGRRMY